MQPSFTDWQELISIALNVEDILTEPTNAEGPGYELVRYMRLTSHNVDRSRQNVAIRRTGLAAGVKLENHVKSVYELLPGLDSFMGSRSEKLNQLKGELLKVSAYKWLVDQPSYVAALQTIARLGKTKPIYAVDTIEFVFLRSILTPLMVIFLYRSKHIVPSYPSKKELEAVFRDTKRVQKFLTTRTPVYGLVAVPVSLQRNLNEFQASLNLVLASYRKPADDGTLRERDFRDQIIQNLLGAMGGECSSTLVGHMLDLIGYPYDARDLQREIKSQRDNERSRRALLQKNGSGTGMNLA